MYKIFQKQIFKNGLQQIEVEAPNLVSRLRPGQFVFVVARPRGRRIPFSAFDLDPRRGSITLFFDARDDVTRGMNDLKVGDNLVAVSGPYGAALPELQKKTVLCFGQGTGSAGILPVCRYYNASRNKVVAAFPLKTRSDLAHDSKLRVCCDKVVITTEDGSYDRRGGLADLFVRLSGDKCDFICADGSLDLYDGVAEFARARGTEAVINLLPHLRNYVEPFETAFFSLGPAPRYPAAEGFWVDAAGFDRPALQQSVQSREEYILWRRSSSRSSLPPGGSGIFPRLFSAFQKDRP
jgi:ferredoxin--NADP+ reductase